MTCTTRAALRTGRLSFLADREEDEGEVLEEVVEGMDNTVPGMGGEHV
jgi:hypothetical protein